MAEKDGGKKTFLRFEKLFCGSGVASGIQMLGGISEGRYELGPASLATRDGVDMKKSAGVCRVPVSGDQCSASVEGNCVKVSK